MPVAATIAPHAGNNKTILLSSLASVTNSALGVRHYAMQGAQMASEVHVFSGHETFAFRYPWLKKGFDAVGADSNIFQRDDAITTMSDVNRSTKRFMAFCSRRMFGNIYLTAKRLVC